MPFGFSPAPLPGVALTILPADAGAFTLLASYVRAMSVAIAAQLPVDAGMCLVMLGTVHDGGAGPLPADDPDLASLPGFARVGNGLFWLGPMKLADAASRFHQTLVAPTDGSTLLVCRARGATGVFSVSA